MSSDFAFSENTFVLLPNSTIEFAFIGDAGRAFHLYGHAFSVIRSAFGTSVNLMDPPGRDVVASGGTTTDPVN